MLGGVVAWVLAAALWGGRFCRDGLVPLEFSEALRAVGEVSCLDDGEEGNSRRALFLFVSVFWDALHVRE